MVSKPQVINSNFDSTLIHPAFKLNIYRVEPQLLKVSLSPSIKIFIQLLNMTLNSKEANRKLLIDIVMLH
jgi:hypothetical protein